MYSGLFAFAVLIVGAQADSYGVVGTCNGTIADETFDYKNIYPLMYVHSITKTPDSELIDGIVVHITALEDLHDVLFKSVDIHSIDGSVTNLPYQDIGTGHGYAREFIYDGEIDTTLEFNLMVIGQLPECGVLVFFRCSNFGTLPQDDIQVYKKDNAPLSDACEAKVEAIIKDKLHNVSPSYVLPYALKNYS